MRWIVIPWRNNTFLIQGHPFHPSWQLLKRDFAKQIFKLSTSTFWEGSRFCTQSQHTGDSTFAHNLEACASWDYTCLKHKNTTDRICPLVKQPQERFLALIPRRKVEGGIPVVVSAVEDSGSGDRFFEVLGDRRAPYFWVEFALKNKCKTM